MNEDKIEKNVFIAEGARIVGDVTIGEGCGIWYNAVLRADEKPIVIGKNTNIQDNCVLHVSFWNGLKIGDNVTVGHSAIVHGCTVGNNTLIGMGSIIMNDAVIGDNCIIGAGALVTEKTEIPSGSLALGSPAKVVRQLTDEEIKRNTMSAELYAQMAAKYISEDQK